MPYRSTEKTRAKKEVKRADLLQASVQVFAQKGYHAATVRDVVAAANVAIGTFYFYFPDKETLFVHLYEETADFLVQAVQQGLANRPHLPQQLNSGIVTYVNLALYQPAMIHLLLVGGVGAVPALTVKRNLFRDKLITIWQRPLDNALAQGVIPPQNTRRTAAGIVGGLDEILLTLLALPNPEAHASIAIQDMTQFTLRAIGYTDQP